MQKIKNDNLIVFVCFFFLGVLISCPLYAVEKNPNLIPFGEEEAFLGNAGIALETSTGATYYNPGALAFIPNRKVSVYGNAYNFNSVSVDSVGRINGVDIPTKSSSFSPIPSGSVTVFGNEKWMYAFSVYVPYSAQYDIQITVNTPAVNVNEILSNSSQSLWLGPSIAHKVNENFSVGLSWFITRYFESTNVMLYSATPSPNAVGSYAFRSKISSWDTLFILGGYWKVSESSSIGLRLQPPSIDVRGRSDFFTNTLSANATQQTSFIVDEKDIYSRKKMGANIGVGWRHFISPRTEILCDVNAQFPLHYQVSPSRPRFSTTVNTRFMPRLNLGTKWQFHPAVKLLGGLLWNPSTVRPKDTVDGLDRENFKGITLGLQREAGVLTTSAGGFFLWSSGEAVIVNSGGATSKVSHQLYGLILTASYKL